MGSNNIISVDNIFKVTLQKKQFQSQAAEQSVYALYDFENNGTLTYNRL